MRMSQIFSTHGVAVALSRYPWWAFAIGLIVTMLMAAGIAKLKLEMDYEVFFAPEAPEIIQFRNFQTDFGREDTLFFAISSPSGETLINEHSLLAIDDFTQRARAIPFVRRVASIANYPLVDSANDEINITAAYYVDDGQIVAGRSMAEIEERLLQEATVEHKLLSSDGDSVGILATLVLDGERRATSAKEAWIATESLMSEMRSLYPMYEFRVTGSTALDAAFEQANTYDLSVLFPVAGTLMMLLAALIFRSIMFYIAMSLVVCAAAVSCLGFAGWAGIPLSSVSITSPVIVTILAIAELMHLFVATRQQRDGDRERRSYAAIKKVFVPALLTTVTTIAGLLMLNFSATPPFRHLGNIASVGVVMAFVATFLLGAPLLRMVSAKSASKTLLDRAVAAIAEFVVTGRGRLSALIVGVGMVLTAGCIFLNEIDDNYVHYFDETFEFRRHSDFIDAHLSGIYSLEYSLKSSSGDIYSAQYLNAVREFSDWARAQPGVRSIDTVEDTIAQVHRAFNNDDEHFRHAPDDSDLIKQYSMLYEMSVPQDFDFRNRVSSESDTSRVTLFLSNLSIAEIAALEDSASNWLVSHPYFGSEPLHSSATGTSILFSHIGLNNIRSMLFGTLLLFAMASALMWLIFKTPSIAVSATLANIIPALATLGLWGLLVGRLGMGAAAIVTVTLGLMIDDTIHLGYRYTKLKHQGLKTQEAVQSALRQVGPALIVTTLILVVGFLLIAMSSFEINASLGLMVATTVAMALLFDLLILPVTLLKFDTEKQTIIGRIEHAQQTI